MKRNISIIAALIAVGALGWALFKNDILPLPITDGTPNENLVVPAGPIKIGESVTLSGVTITPLSVTEESRCPIDYRCIQAGTVKVSTRIKSSSASVTQEIELNKPATVGENIITLTSVTPYPKGGTSIAPSDYRFEYGVKNKISSPISSGKCYIGGCSAQICSDQEGVASTCEFRAEYACYQGATCERQSNGQCGWTETSKLLQCLANPPAL